MSSAPTTAPPSRPYLPFLDVARVVAVLGVVLIHVIAGDVSEGTVGPGWTAVNMIASAAVPVFLMMAGALSLSPTAHHRGTREFLRRRAVRIIPALLVWSVLYLVVLKGWVMGGRIDAATVVDAVITGDTYTHLYFLWAIAGLYLLTPVIAAFLRVGDEAVRAWWTGLLACLWTAVVMATGTLTSAAGLTDRVPVEKGSLTYALLFLGYYVVGRAALVAPMPRRWAYAALAACVPLVGLMTALKLRAGEQNPVPVDALLPSYTSPVLMVYSILLFSAMAALTGSWRVDHGARRFLRPLGDATFGVFLVHFVILLGVRELPLLGGSDSLSLIVTWLLTSALSFAFAMVAVRVPGLRQIV